MDKWLNKVALVTGSSVGIGAEIALSLANAGLIVVGLARRVELIEELAGKVTGSGRICPLKCDLTKEEEILSAIEWINSTLGGIHVLINNAGVLRSELIIESPTDVYRQQFDINVIATCIVIRETVKSMKSRNVRGHIIVLNSVLGHRIPDLPIPCFNVYPASKFALSAITQTIKQEFRFCHVPIKFTSISPGMVETDLLDAFPAHSEDFKRMLPKLQPEDVAEAVLYALGTPDRVQINEIILEAVPVGPAAV